ncbi:hypothetical protein EG68_10148 [Paragonimus skrjabini miyazakii]|uniref:BTB domain-containing protein n=1 Tax=Paragonimus skrjabini miyazakii TaxID=59628 RepID=A0A8S9YFH0_9TREM|nr:hypothetical protein EG68_10148 [Paragonimus skrjabini miyazakii]
MNEFQKIHVQTVSINLQQLVADRKFLDVTLAVQGHEIQSNRMVLSASSEYFRGLFEFYGSHSPLPKRSHYDLTSEFLTIKGFQFIVNFIHSLGQLCDPIPKEDYECLYTAASFLQVESLHAMLSNLIGCHLDSTSVLQALRLATVFDDPQLYQKCMLVLLDQFQTVDIFSNEYFNLSQRHIQTIFLSDRVKVSRESFMVKQEELRVVVTNPRFAEARELLDLLVYTYSSLTGLLAFSNHLTSTHITGDISCILNGSVSNTKARIGTNFHVYSVGGLEELNAQDAQQTPEFFSADLMNPVNDCLSPLSTPAELARVHHAVTCSLSWIYVIGGESEDGQLMNHCCKYNLIERAWFPMAVLNAPRSHHNAICIESFVYAFGGYQLNWVSHYSPATDSILIYDCLADQWSPAPHHLPFAAIDMGAVLLPPKRLVMLAGGLHEHGAEMRPSDEVILYDPAEENDACFIRLPRLPLVLFGLALAYDQTSDTVFACGGRTSDSVRTADQLNIHSSGLSGQILAFNFDSRCWSLVTTLDCPRYYASAGVLSQSTLYVLGGITSDEIMERTAPLFLTDSHDFRLLGQSDLGGPDHSALASDQALFMDRLYGVTYQRSNLLQAPFRTCQFTEAWCLRNCADNDPNVDVVSFDESFEFSPLSLRTRRLKCSPLRHKDRRLLITRCMSVYCIAPHFS